ncbi:hypothetical protein OG883_38315 [Streptomyces sp. NBC_01142]|uniref:hypothetical protein n=1 Tax=Streptomyces sp. NBC_01142 TaxID=2975865 RepID=UPI002255D84E|nr:hypothetical protein [Streptomyces sp. NBC_01142]MCX4825608.1 hypothetical protein [Streptomyces sp. NBC_01142]
MNATQVSALTQPTTPQWARDVYRCPLLQDFEQQDAAGAVEEAGDYFLPAPDPKQRLSFTLAAPDKRRLDLHAALTTTGIAPLPGDLHAIHALCTLDDTTIRTVLRWITSPR